MMNNQPSKKSILLLDDDELLRDMYSVKFKEQGFIVETADSVENGLERLRGGLSPHAIVFDMVMPGRDGYDFLETMMSEKLAPQAIKIALSNQGGDTDVEKARALGATGYIIKANSVPSEVVAKVIALLT